MSDLIRRDEVLRALADFEVPEDPEVSVYIAWGIGTAMRLTKNVPAVDAVEVTYCDQCDIHGHCITEDTFRLVGVEKPFCCVGGRREEDAVD